MKIRPAFFCLALVAALWGSASIVQAQNGVRCSAISTQSTQPDLRIDFLHDPLSGNLLKPDFVTPLPDLEPFTLDPLERLVEELNALGTRVALIVPMHRGAAMGSEMFTRLQPIMPRSYPELLASYQSNIEQLHGVDGLHTVDFSTLFTENPILRTEHFLPRDNHWSPAEADASIALLRSRMASDWPPQGTHPPELVRLSPQDVPIYQTFEQEIEDRCGISFAPVIRTVEQTVEGTGANLANDLFGTQDGHPDRPRIILLGSSFSNLRGVDTLRVADSVAWHFKAHVTNLALPGGGPQSAIEAWLAAGHHRSDPVDLVIWEVPHATRLTTGVAMHQLAGLAAPRCRRDTRAQSVQIDLTDEWQTLPLAGGRVDQIDLRTPGLVNERIRVAVDFTDGTSRILILSKSDRIDQARRTDLWAAWLQRPTGSLVREIRVRLDFDENRPVRGFVEICR